MSSDEELVKWFIEEAYDTCSFLKYFKIDASSKYKMRYKNKEYDYSQWDLERTSVVLWSDAFMMLMDDDIRSKMQKWLLDHVI
jgi:hypothetical protein